MLDDRQHARAQQPFGYGAAKGGDLSRRIAISAITDHVMRARDGNVEHRGAVHVDAQRRELAAHQFGASPRRGQPALPVLAVERREGARGRIGAPDRRTETLYAPALLVDQNESIG